MKYQNTTTKTISLRCHKIFITFKPGEILEVPSTVKVNPLLSPVQEVVELQPVLENVKPKPVIEGKKLKVSGAKK